MKKIFLIVLCLCLIAGITNSWAEKEVKGKYAIILQTPCDSMVKDGVQSVTPTGIPRMITALLYARELKAIGNEVVFIYDGAGTVWASELHNPKHPLHGYYLKLKEAGIPEVVCDHCAAHYRVQEGLESFLNGDYETHVSIGKYTEKGYQIIVM